MIKVKTQFLPHVYLKERAECDVWEVVMGTVPATVLVRLLPKIEQRLLQRPDWTQVEDVVPR